MTELGHVMTRAYAFGDGIFETIMVNKGEIRHFDYHEKRIRSGLLVLGLKANGINWKNELDKLIESNDSPLSRLKLIICRSASGSVGYGSTNNNVEFLITQTPIADLEIKYISSSDFAKEVKLAYTKTSSVKTLSALPYVLAARERDSRNVQELILTNGDDHVSECTSSNIFWIKNNELFTSPLSTGCVKGIMRSVIEDQFTFTETSISEEELKKVQAIFSTNVARMTIFKSFKQHDLKYDHSIIEKIKQLWVL